MAFTIVLFLHASQVAALEHVLYSQKEEGTYPAVLVLITTAVGVGMAVRLRDTGVLSLTNASFIAASYGAKVVTFLVEVTDAYYIGDSDDMGSAQVQLLRVWLAWLSALVVGFVVLMFELQPSRRFAERYVQLLVGAFYMGIVILSVTTAPNVQRAAFEFLSQRHLSPDIAMHVTLGTAVTVVGAAASLFLSRYAPRYPQLRSLLQLSGPMVLCGAVLVLFPPTRLLDTDGSVLDGALSGAAAGHYATIAGFTLLGASAFAPLHRMPAAVRAICWLVGGGFLSYGVTLFLLPSPSTSFAVGVSCFLFFSLMTVDVGHYRELRWQEVWIVYGLSVVCVLVLFFSVGRLDLWGVYAGPQPSLATGWQMEAQLRLLSIFAVVSLFIAVLLKCRLSRRSLLPDALPLTEELLWEVAHICNYATMFAVFAFSTVNAWGNGGSPAIYCVTAVFLLLLSEDNLVVTNSLLGLRRYLPPILFALAMLWFTLVSDSWAQGMTVPESVVKVAGGLLCGSLILPSQWSLVRLLMLGKKKGGIPLTAVLAFVCVDILCLLLTRRRAVQGMAMISLGGQCFRIFEAQFSKLRVEAYL